jgi:sirohydrochlorin cobaltochelatase
MSQPINTTGNPAVKKAILVVSFGTTYADTRKACIESIENRIAAAFPGYAVRRAFTSRIVIRRLAERDGILIDNEIQALDRLQAEGYAEVYIQPLHIVAGEEYEKIRRIVIQYAHAKKFDRLTIGRPLLYYMGQEDKPDDYLAAINALDSQFAAIGADEALVFVGHGGVHPANAAYAVLQLKLEEACAKNVFVYTVEGFPALERIVERLTANNVKNVRLAPFMLVAGDHANNDIAGDEADSAKSILTAAGFRVDVSLHGLGENQLIQDIYVQHLNDVIEQPSGHARRKQ